MKKTKLLNAELSQLIASMGHGDVLVIGDAGLPCPPGVPWIDLAVTQGVPSFADVLAAVMSELEVERAAMAEEASDSLRADVARAVGVELSLLPHETFKVESQMARAVVRTGETVPYANVALWAGVVF